MGSRIKIVMNGNASVALYWRNYGFTFPAPVANYSEEMTDSMVYYAHSLVHNEESIRSTGTGTEK